MLKIASCDSQGSVYISDHAVYRLVDRKHKQHVLAIMGILKELSSPYIINTEFCFDKSTLDEVGAGPDHFVLKHSKIEFISYPHEWCASMLKDAAILHVDLSLKLLAQGLFLKDAHPWNILFEKSCPVLVDLPSIVSRDSLFAEEYLESNKKYQTATDCVRLVQNLKEIFTKMYLPYFFNPLCAYAFGKSAQVAKRIEETTLNASASIISLRDYLPEWHLRFETVGKIIRLLKVRRKFNSAIGRLTDEDKIPAFYRNVIDCIADLKVSVITSAYSNYYSLKGEAKSWAHSDEWNDKHKAVYQALSTPGITTVLDVACNTGWFAVLAEKLGKRVVAFDIDQACIELLYDQVKTERLNILPLVMDFMTLTEDRYSLHDKQVVLINATHRLRCDAVLALGIFHHLILGAGLLLEEVLARLVPLCNKLLIIEFVDMNDPVIQNEPNFFHAYCKDTNMRIEYKLEKLIALCETHGFKVRIEKSYPSTRTILVCEK